tara:strand:- start:158 stop:1327 length:1170 start_codon:yes stop_codon:yes gene_type:complete
MNAAHKPGKPTKAELAAHDEAVATAGCKTAPQAIDPGFDGIIGQDQGLMALQSALLRNRLPHALLFSGPSGIGKATIAGVLTQALNCMKSGGRDACGTCSSCHKVKRGLHPDVLWVAPDKGRIRLQQISPRKSDKKETASPHTPIVNWVGYRPYEGNRRVVVIDDAHKMNSSAQNALLKTLEEPPQSSTLVLITPAPSSLLPTIRSRCQTLRFKPLGLAVMRRYLEKQLAMSAEEARLRSSLAPGSLGRAINLDLDAHGARRDVAEGALKDALQGGAALLTGAETLLAAGAGERKIDQASSAIDAVRDILHDLLVLTVGNQEEMVVNFDRTNEWAAWASTLAPDDIVEALGTLQQADDRLRSPLQPNARLTIEQALIEVGSALRNKTAE